MTMPSKVTESLLKQILQDILAAGSVWRLAEILMEYENAGLITAEENDQLYNTYLPILSDYLMLPQNAKSYLKGFTSGDDLADRLKSDQLKGLSLGEESKANIWDFLMMGTPKSQTELNQARQRATLSQQKQELAQRDIGAGISQAMTDFENNKGLTPQEKTQYRSLFQSLPKDASLIQSINTVNRYGQEKFAQQYNQDQQRTFAYLHSQRLDEPAPWTPPPLPGISDIIQGYQTEMGKTYGGEGTRIRDFINSQLGKTVQGTQGAREAWWAAMNPAPKISQLESAQAGLPRAQALLAEFEARQAGPNPINPLRPGNTWEQILASAPGSLAGIEANIAEAKAWEIPFEEATPEYRAKGIYRSGAGEAPPQPEKAEDPLKAALRNRQWLLEYNRLPGVGVSSRLAPAIRFR